jgi:putative MATE family efflux protein
LNRIRALLDWDPPFRRQFFNLAIPIIVQSLVASSMHLLDNIMIGRVGEMEMAAVTQANRLTFLLNLALFGLTSGSAAFASQAWGKRDVPRIQQTMGMALCMSCLFLMLFITLAIGFPHLVARAMLTDPAARESAVSYLRIIGVGYIFLALSNILESFQKSTEQTRVPMIAGVVAISINTILNFLLIFGMFGFPKMGVRGAAIATVIALAIECAINLIGGYAAHSVTAVRPRALIPNSWRFAWQYLQVVSVVILNEFMWSLGVTMFSVIYGRMGEQVVAAVGIASTFEQFSVVALRAITGACAVMVGGRVGAGEKSGARETSLRMIVAAIVIAIASGFIIIMVGNILMNFYNVSEATKANARVIMITIACFMPFNALASILIVGILRSGGDAAYSLLIDTVPLWIIAVPLAAITGLVLHLPISFVIVCNQIETVIKVALGFWRFQSGRWIHDLTQTPQIE